MAQVLGSELSKLPQIELTQPVESNGVFAVIPKEFIPELQQKYFFYVWDDEISEVRLMASFDTTEDDVRDFVEFVRKTVKGSDPI
jgi:threonine aldolase